MIRNININIFQTIINLVVALLASIIFAQTLSKEIRGVFATEVVIASLIPLFISPLIVSIELRFNNYIKSPKKMIKEIILLFLFCMSLVLFLNILKPAGVFVGFLRFLIAFSTIILLLFQKLLMVADQFKSFAIVSISVNMLYIICVFTFVTEESQITHLLLINLILPLGMSVLCINIFLKLKNEIQSKTVSGNRAREITCSFLSDIVNFSFFKLILILPISSSTPVIMADHRIAMTFSELLLKMPRAVAPVVRAMTINNILKNSQSKNVLCALIILGLISLSLFVFFGSSLLRVLFGEKYLSSYDEALMYLFIGIMLTPRIVSLSRLHIKSSFNVRYIYHSLILLLLVVLSYISCMIFLFEVKTMLIMLLTISILDFSYIVRKLIV